MSKISIKRKLRIRPLTIIITITKVVAYGIGKITTFIIIKF